MSGGARDRTELVLELVPAGMLAAACAYSTVLLAQAYGMRGGDLEGAILVAGLAYFLCRAGLSRVLADPRGLPDFVLAGWPDFDSEDDELLLTEALAVQAESDATEELLLDDVLPEAQPDSRVVRLFDRAAMPTPGQLKARIDRHLGAAGVHQLAPDASAALSQALSDLRRSLR